MQEQHKPKQYACNDWFISTWDEISNQMPSARHANTAKVKYCKPSRYFPINPCNGMCLLSLLREPAGSTDAFPCLFYFSQPLTALHNCQNWLVSALALAGSDINFYTEWKWLHIPFWNVLEYSGARAGHLWHTRLQSLRSKAGYCKPH